MKKIAEVLLKKILVLVDNNNNWNSSFNNNKLSRPIGGERNTIASGKPYVSYHPPDAKVR